MRKLLSTPEVSAYVEAETLPGPQVQSDDEWLDFARRNGSTTYHLIGTCKMNGVEPYAYLRDLFTRIANGHLDRDIDALMPWAYAAAAETSQ